MKLRCEHEAEVRELLRRGHWPDASPAELRAHAAACRVCGDRVLLTQAFQGARSSAAQQVLLPPPGVLWRRAQLLKRNAEIARIDRPVLGAHLFALATLLLIAAAVALSHWKQTAGWMTEMMTDILRVPASPDWLHPDPTHATLAHTDLGYLVPGLVLIALLGGVAAYLAREPR